MWCLTFPPYSLNVATINMNMNLHCIGGEILHRYWHKIYQNSRCRAVFLHSFISALFLYPEWSFAYTFPLSFYSLFWEFLNHTPYRRQSHFTALETNTLALNTMHFALEMNISVLETKVSRAWVQTSATCTQLATSDFQTKLCQDNCYSQVFISKNRWHHTPMLLTSTHLLKQAVSHSDTHLWVQYTHKFCTCICNSVVCWTNTAALIPGSRPFNGSNWANFKLSQNIFLNTSILKAIWLG